MRILLTGATGFIGSNVLSYLKEKTEWDVAVTTTDLQWSLPDMGRFDVILHLASLSSVEQSITTPDIFIKNNVAITTNMLEYARKYPPKLFINFSTTGIYSGGRDDDWGSVLPTNPYIASKVSQEAIATAYYRTYGIPVIITSANNVVGPNQTGDKFVPRIIESILNNEEVSIYATGGEFGSRVYNPVKNVADALMFIIDNVRPLMGAERPDRYSLGGGESLNNLEMAKQIAVALGRKLKYKVIEAESVRPGYDKHYEHADNKLSELGWEPPYSLKEELLEIVEGIV